MPDVAEVHSPTAWVTGASRGLGRAIALGLAAAGFDIALTARDVVDLEKTATEIHALGRRTLLLPADVSDPDRIQEVSETIVEQWHRLDVCVAAAGISPVLKDSLDVTNEEWRSILGINLDGTFWTMREAGRMMKSLGTPGSIIAISSVHARSAGKRLPAYSASKGAIEALVRTLATDWAGLGIRVNALAPGYFETDLTAGLQKNERMLNGLLAKIPLDRFGTPEELAPAAVFLATDASAYMTGSVLVIDGGWTAG